VQGIVERTDGLALEPLAIHIEHRSDQPACRLFKVYDAILAATAQFGDVGWLKSAYALSVGTD
jgi:hypothetical protein